MKKLLLPLLIAAALSGCASFPENYEKPTRGADVAAELQDVWSSVPAITKVTSKAGITIKKFNEVPSHVLSRHINLKIENGQGLAIADVVAALRAQGVRMTSTLKDSDKHEIVNSFTGDLGMFLDQLTVEHNIGYEYRNDVLFLTESSRYVVTLPQHEEFLKEVVKSVTEMGGTSVRGDVRSSRLYFLAKPDVAPMIEEYIGHIAANAAMLKMQVAVITVRLTRDFSLGLDWANLQAGAGRGQLAPGITPIFPKESTTTAVPGTTGTTGTTAAATAAETAIKLGQVLGFAGGTGGTFTVANQAFSLTAAIKALSTYGNARTEQNVTMGTLNGLKVKIESGNDIPYVKKIGSATTSGGGTSGSSETDIVKSGLTVELTPYFDAEDKSVVSTMHVNMASLVGFRELPAGLNLGMMSLPEMQKLGFDNVGRLSVGETLVLGGITYDQLDNNYTNLPGMEAAATGSKSEKTSRFAVYIVLRPTVTVFETEKVVLPPAPAHVEPVLPAALPVIAPVVTPVVPPPAASKVLDAPVKLKKRTKPAPGALKPASAPVAVPVGSAVGAVKPAGLPHAVPATKGAYVPSALVPVKPVPGVVEPGAKSVRPVTVAPNTPIKPVESK